MASLRHHSFASLSYIRPASRDRHLVAEEFPGGHNQRQRSPEIQHLAFDILYLALVCGDGFRLSVFCPPGFFSLAASPA
jgi:hypothetical protein